MPIPVEAGPSDAVALRTTRIRDARRKQTAWTPSRTKRMTVFGYGITLPAFAIFVTLILYPTAQTVYLSLTSWDGISKHKTFVGLANYREVFRDPVALTALRHNVIWIVLGTLAPLAIGLLLAILVFSTKRFAKTFTAIFFIPQVIPPVVVGLLFEWIYDPNYGLLDRLLTDVGLRHFAKAWLSDPRLAVYAVVGAAVWVDMAFAFVVYLAGLQNVDSSLVEAALVDGANSLQRVRHILVPQLSSVTTLISVVLLIRAFDSFDLTWIMTQGGPAHGTELVATYAYDRTFNADQVGYGAALSTLITVVMLVVSLGVVRYRERSSR